MLKNEGFEVEDINMNAYMQARTLTQEFIDDWLGYFINPANKHMSSLLLGCGLPGGMMGSMMADLGGIQTMINKLREKKGEPVLTMDDMLVKLFNEVEYVWPRVGYPPLVTPFSQYTKNIALMNLLTMEQGKGRYAMMDDAIWGMILGKSGKIPGTIAPELVELAQQQKREFTDVDPHTLIPNALDGFKKEMDENGWDYGKDNEELFELAMPVPSLQERTGQEAVPGRPAEGKGRQAGLEDERRGAGCLQARQGRRPGMSLCRTDILRVQRRGRVCSVRRAVYRSEVRGGSDLLLPDGEMGRDCAHPRCSRWQAR